MAKDRCAANNCKELPLKNDTLCANHRRLKTKADELAKTQKAQEEKLKKESQAKKDAGVLLQAKNAKLATDKAAKIKELAPLWNAQVKAVVTAVLNLRHAHPTLHGINAGSNKDEHGHDLPVIPGGTNNPITFVLPSNTLGLTKADIYHAMSGFEGSDSGSFKFRVSDVFVHGH